MERRTSLLAVLLVVLAAGAVLCSPPPAGPRSSLTPAAGQASPEARVEAILRSAPVFDGHNDLPWEMRTRAWYDLDKIDLRQSQPELMTDIARLRAGHVGRSSGRCTCRRVSRAGAP